MDRAEIENKENGILLDLNSHKNLLVSFGGIRQGLGIPVFEFFNSIADIPCDKIFLRDFGQAWYQKGVDSEINHIDKVIQFLRSKIEENKYDKVCFLGNSMGGYASILFGSLLNVDIVIAFVPQTFINKFNRFIYQDKRWSRQINNIYNYKKKRTEYFDLKKHLKENNSYNTLIHVYYSPNELLDKKHAERLRSLKNVQLHPIAEGGHSVVKVVRDSGKLKELILKSFQ